MKEKIPKKELESHEFRVTIFGSARIPASDPAYKDIYKLAKSIGKMGVDVITGGGPGIMSAASSGHSDGNDKAKKKSNTIGLNIRLPFEQKPNTDLDMLENHDRFSTRLDEFMLLSSMVVVAPGGIGTCLELFYTWQLLQVHHLKRMPIVLVGDMWKDLMKWVKKWPLKDKLMSEEDMHFIFIVDTWEEALGLVKTAKLAFDKQGRSALTNWEIYGKKKY